MARLTREQSAARTRANLLDAAADVFAEKGFGSASLDEIAERAGYTRGAVYTNFADKEDLFLSVFDREREVAREELHTVLARIATPQQGLDAFAAQLRARASRTKRLYLLMTEARQFAIRNKTMGRRLARHEQESRALIEEAISAIFGSTSLPMGLVALIAQALDNGFWALYFVDPKVTIDEYVDALGLLVRALAALQVVGEVTS